MAVYTRVIGLDKLVDKFDKLRKIDLTPEIREGTIKIQRTAKDKAPVDTGALRGSIRRSVKKPRTNEVYGEVYTETEYGPYQEFGTWKMKSHPYMRPAMNINRLGILKSMEKYLKDNINKIAKQ